MKMWIAVLCAGCFLGDFIDASTITVVSIFEPLSLHETDGDDVIEDSGEALQACVMSRPMALTGAFPEMLVDAIRSPHLIPTNNPNYHVKECNLLVICNIGIRGEISDHGLMVSFEISQLNIPPGIDLTSRQVLKLAIVALRKTLEEYQRLQTRPLAVTITVQGATDGKAGLRDLDSKFIIEDGPR